MVSIILTLACVVNANPAPVAAKFRVDTEITAEGGTHQRRTLFDGSYIIDYDPAQPGEKARYVLYDLAGQRIVSLDPAKKQQSSLLCSDLTHMMDEVRSGLTEEQAASFGVNVKPTRTPEGRLQVSVSGYRYEVLTSPEPLAGIAKAYADFANWAAMLNVLERQGAPPFARMRLNDTLSLFGEVPQALHLIRADGTSVGSVHRFQNGLTAEDQSRLTFVREQLALVPAVAWDLP